MMVQVIHTGVKNDVVVLCQHIRLIGVEPLIIPSVQWDEFEIYCDVCQTVHNIHYEIGD